MDNLPIVNNRSCGTCTKCCEGNLRFKLKEFNIEVLNSKPCPFVEANNGCTIHERRPQSPCRDFLCDWLTNEDIPEELKPSLTNTIIYTKTINGIKFMRLTEAGSKMDSAVLSWATQYCISNRINFVWRVEDKVYWFGDPNFNLMMEEQKKIDYRDI